ncbi:MAG: hypothetical protein JW749_08975 [Sedimentisphaerales bacterium]|nr:hypothetical protein [Sedimentisphaerales bacterium]
MVIYPEKNKKQRVIALFLIFSLLIWVSQAFGADPNDLNTPIIETSEDSFTFTENNTSQELWIWNIGTGTLYYSLSIDGNDADYFIIDGTIGDVNGYSTGASDKKKHFVNMSFDQWPDTTLNARIVITDVNDSNNVAYITLTALPPIIKTSTDSLYFTEGNSSQNFEIWTGRTDTLYYTLSIDGDDADYFIIDDTPGDVNGYSTGADDKKMHTVDMDYDQWPDTTLNARIVITDVNDGNNVAYITLTALPSKPNSSSNIGRSTGRIELVGKVTSKKFQIWNNNKEDGVLDYTITIIGVDDQHFTLDTEEGQSEDKYDKQTHTVYVDYEDLHNTTLYAWIVIEDNNDNVAYINLSATETVATRVPYIFMEQSINYTDDVESNVFYLFMVTDDTVEQVDFNTPEGEEFSILDYTENDDGSIRCWTYPEDPDEVIDLADFGDGTYTIVVTYQDDDVAQTKVNFGIPNKPGTIPWPTQIPVLLNPEPEDETVSPVRLEWEKCTDPNADSVRLILENLDSFDDDENTNLITKEYSKGTTRSSAFTLETGQWRAGLSFGRWYHVKKGNNDGIEFEVGKCIRSYSDFEIMKWFGTFDEFKNHTLKIADCCGTEVTFNLTGGGWGEIADGNDFNEITLTGTTAKSVFSITNKKGTEITVGDIKTKTDETDGDINDIKAIIGRNVNLEGDITITGGARSILLNNASGDISIGSYDSPKIIPCVLKFNKIDDLDLDSNTPIRNLQATHWNSGSLTAPWISTMKIKGDFGADLILSGDNSPKGMTLKSAKIAGELFDDDEVDDDVDWSVVTGNCGTIQVAASSADFSADIDGNIGTIKAVGYKGGGIDAVLSGDWNFGTVKAIKADTIEQCDIVADGIDTEEEQVTAIGSIYAKNWITDSTIDATEAGNIGKITAGGLRNCEYITTDGTLACLQIKGIKNEAYCLINSDVYAERIRNAYLSYPKYSNGGVPFEISANSIEKITLKDSSRKTTWKNLEIGSPQIKIQDFEINLE